MARHMGALTIEITKEAWEEASRSKSGGCLIAEAIEAQYKQLVNVKVNVALIRATDTRSGLRYSWTTPRAAQMILLHFDQGWSHPGFYRIQTRRPAHIAEPVLQKGRAEARASRLAELEARDPETLTAAERSGLTRLRATPPRPTREGKSRVISRRGDETKIGGQRIPTGGTHPNMLAGRDRHFGMRLANPGEVFEAAVTAEIARRQEAGEL